MSTERISLSSLSVQGDETVATHTEDTHHHHHSHKGKKNFGGGFILAFILFIFLVLIVFIILAAWAPNWLLAKDSKKKGGRSCDDDSKSDCGCDYTKTFLWAIVISFVLVILFWLLAGITAAFARLGKKCW
jgi:uncharacterized membrane protein (DUF485 family)